MNDKIMNYIEEFRKEFTMGLEAIRNAARIYTAAVTEFDGEAAKAFRTAFPAVSDTTWRKLLLIGTFQAEPITLLLSDRMSNKIASKTPSQQKKLTNALKNGEVDVVRGRAKTVHRVKVQDLSEKEEDRVIDVENCRVRSAEEQTRIIDLEKEEKSRKEKSRKDFEIVGSTLYVYRPHSFELDELCGIVEKMKASK